MPTHKECSHCRQEVLYEGDAPTAGPSHDRECELWRATTQPVTHACSATRSSLTPMRRLTYRLLSLPWVRRVMLTAEMGLLRDEDRGLGDVEMFREVLRRAQDGGRLAELWHAVCKAHGRDEPSPWDGPTLTITGPKPESASLFIQDPNGVRYAIRPLTNRPWSPYEMAVDCPDCMGRRDLQPCPRCNPRPEVV